MNNEMAAPNERRNITGAEALRRTVSYARACWRERAGVADDEEMEEVEQICANWLLQVCARGEAAAPRRNGPILIDSLIIDRGALHSMLAQSSIATLCGRTPIAPASRRDVGVVTPLHAIQMAIGETGGFTALQAGYARRAHQRGWLADHANGAGELAPAVVARLSEIAEEDDARDAVRTAAMDKLRADIIAGKRIAFARGRDGAVRPLTRGDFAPDIVLDLVSGRFLPHPSLRLDSTDWGAARNACDAIGEVLVSLADASPAWRRTATAAAERRAERRLRRRIEAWLAEGAEMSAAPRKAEWVAGEGKEITGSAAGAMRVWHSAVESDPRCAPLRHGGRRPRPKP